jgi:hypothetical protein
MKLSSYWSLITFPPAKDLREYGLDPLMRIVRAADLSGYFCIPLPY